MLEEIGFIEIFHGESISPDLARNHDVFPITDYSPNGDYNALKEEIFHGESISKWLANDYVSNSN